jgi:hypothetical protein
MSKRSQQRVELSYSVISEWVRDSSGRLRSEYISPSTNLGSVLRMEVYFDADVDPRESFAALFTETFVSNLRRKSRGAPLLLVFHNAVARQHVDIIVREVFTRCGNLFPKVFC